MQRATRRHLRVGSATRAQVEAGQNTERKTVCHVLSKELVLLLCRG